MQTIPDEAMLLMTMAIGPDSIRVQEIQGQSALVNSTNLPTKRRGDYSAMIAAGLKFGEPDPDDPMFCACELPPGWRKQGSDHAMWSYLLDDKGRKRAAIFYKAAFYDQRANMSAESRINIVYLNDERRAVKDSDRVLFTSTGGGDYHATDEAREWADKHFPNWRSEAAYWDLDDIMDAFVPDAD